MILGPSRRWALILFFAALAVRLVFVMLRSVPPFSDEIAYRTVALAIWETGSHVGHLLRPPGYSYFEAPFLGLFGGAGIGVQLAQTFLGAAVVPMIYLLALDAGIAERAARAGAALFVLLWQPVLHTQVLLSDTFFVTLSVAGLFLVLRRGPASVLAHAAAGLLLGWAWITRQVGLVGLAVALVAMIAARQRRGIAPLLIGAALPVFFVLAMNWRSEHRLFLESNNGFNLWLGNAPGADPFGMNNRAAEAFPPLPGESLLETNDRARGAAVRAILSDPGTFAQRWIVRVGQMFGPNPGREILHAFRGRIDPRASIAIHAIQSLVLWGVTGAGLVLAFPKEPRLRAACLYILVYTGLVATAVVIPRYRLPILPFACLLFAHGIAAWPQATRRRRIAAALVVALIAANMAAIGACERTKLKAPGYLQEWAPPAGAR